ncbi:interleukin-1 beta-like [Centropristis striata]|uniref:interleukin-1 beta-like n=1 Tax=Centropristis striata TaxID=184440 RepID=UPI0027E0E4DF|nr:interleukin-1 beta-like [Centropristis striata]
MNTMQPVASLLLVVNRMKSLSLCGGKLSGSELCSAIMESLVTETIVKTALCPSSRRRRFVRVDSVKQCTLCDVEKKDLVVSDAPGKVELQAITLRGGSSERKVEIKLSKYVSPVDSEDEVLTVVLSIANNLHISCCMKDDRAVLNLEECSEEDLTNISDDRNTDRFLFYKRNMEVDNFTFESVKCSGWFISTSDLEHQPVEMCEVDACRYTRFKIN